ncbi:hypothetical protein GCM10011328_13000 [Hafnia psychrotolerans]|uniref:Uncharacterized protein n=1 Tax=Hafnia psychrotolerans TaxID=1477018 RepID=A0ABQ1G9P0_9GAMM|nr:hypothetical protein GCM10011328_13000 [Hafnia psychrotolerans]
MGKEQSLALWLATVSDDETWGSETSNVIVLTLYAFCFTNAPEGTKNLRIDRCFVFCCILFVK